MLPIPPSSRTGGCTFAEDPQATCAEVTPVWSAAADPCVLAILGAVPADAWARFRAFAPHVREGEGGIAHLALGRCGDLLRLDIVAVAGDARHGAGAFAPLVALERDLAPQFAAVRRLSRILRGALPVRPPEAALGRHALALRTLDALAGGSSLRDIGVHLLGGDDWPGDGEHLKSRARRLVGLARALERAGPRGVLRGLV